jgi:hypothetical protein
MSDAFGFFSPENQYLGHRQNNEGDDKQQETQREQSRYVKVIGLTELIGQC